jgi:serine/threonine protein kinase
VYKVENKRTGEVRAAKIMKRANISQEAHLKLMNEIDILRKVDHPNIIKIYEAYIFENVYCIITEYCEGGSLLRCLQSGKQLSD